MCQTDHVVFIVLNYSWSIMTSFYSYRVRILVYQYFRLHIGKLGTNIYFSITHANWALISMPASYRPTGY